MPRLVAAFLLITLSSIALPGMNGFIGEFLILVGAFLWSPKFAALASKADRVFRALLTTKPRPVCWTERRQRIDEIGSTWPVADDVRLEPVDLAGVPGEWSIVPGSDASRVLTF